MNTVYDKRSCSIDVMEQLIDQIDEFKQLMEQSDNLSDPAFRQECRLFNQYIQWRIEDINHDTRQVMDSLK